jgi:hypothetical protein
MTESEPKHVMVADGGKRRTAVSSFKDLASAERAVSRAMAKNESRIREWAKTAKTGANLQLEISFWLAVGHGRQRNAKKMVKMRRARVVLTKQRFNTMSYHVLTAFPVPSRRGSIQNDYPALSDLFGAYLNQDYDLTAATLEGVLRHFVAVSPDETVVALRADATRFLQEDVARLDAEFERRYGFDFDPQLWGHTAKSFLEWLVANAWP